MVANFNMENMLLQYGESMVYGSAFMNGACFVFFLMLGLLFYARRHENHLKKVLSFILLYWSVLLLKDFVYYLPVVQQNEHLYDFWLLIDMTVVPTCVFYAIELLSPHIVTGKIVLFHGVPFLLCPFIYLLVGQTGLFPFLQTCAIMYSIGVFFFIVIWMKRYRKRIQDMYSDIDQLDVKWLWLVVFVMLFVLFSWVSLSYYTNFFSDMLYYVLIMCVWGIISYKSLRQKTPIKIEEATDEMTLEEEQEVVADNELSAFFSKGIHRLFEEENIARNPHLTLSDTVKLIGTNRSYFSAYINNEMGMTFYELVNGYRLKYAEELLKATDFSMTQSELAMAVGFNSLSTFKRAFMKKHNMTPSQFRLQYVQQNLPDAE